MRARTRWVAGLAAATILLTATVTAFGYTGQVEAIVGVAAQGTITCGEPFTMTATILDANGAPVADQSVDWTFVTKQSASDTINTDADGHERAGHRHDDRDAGRHQRSAADPRDRDRGRREHVRRRERVGCRDPGVRRPAADVDPAGGCACRWRARRCRPAPGARGPCRRRAGAPALGLTSG